MKIKRTGNHYVYIVECCDGSFYTGYTPNLENRIKLHNSGRGAKYTRDRRPVKLIWHRLYKYFRHAFLAEKRIKKLPRQQKEFLVLGRKPVKKRKGVHRANRKVLKKTRVLKKK